jgi:hypothetical protein
MPSLMRCLKLVTLFMIILIKNGIAQGGFVLFSPGQKFNFNKCLLLQNIFKTIEREHFYAELYSKINEKVKVYYDDNGFNIKKINDNIEDRELDSIIALPFISELFHLEDSLYYLSEINYLIDTFNVFTSKCNFVLGDKQIMVVNSYGALPPLKDYNLIKVVGMVANERGRFIILRHSSSRNMLDCVSFSYKLKNKIPIVNKVDVIRKYDYYMDTSQFDD